MGSVSAVSNLPKYLQPDAYRNQIIAIIVASVLVGIGVGTAYHALLDKEIFQQCQTPMTLLLAMPACFNIPVYGLIIIQFFRFLSFDLACKKAAGFICAYSLTIIVVAKVTQISVCIFLPKLFQHDVLPEECLKKASTFGDRGLAEDVFKMACKQKVRRPSVIKYASNLKDASFKRDVVEACLTYENSLKDCIHEATQSEDESVKLPVFLKGLQNPMLAPDVLQCMKRVKDGNFKREVLSAALLDEKNIPHIFNAMFEPTEESIKHDPEFVKKVISRAKDANISLKYAVPVVAQTKDDALIKEVWLKEISKVEQPMDVLDLALKYGSDDITKAVFASAVKLNKSQLQFDLCHKVCEIKRSDLLIHLLENGLNILNFRSTVQQSGPIKETITRYSLLYLAVKHEMKESMDYLVTHHPELVNQEQTVHKKLSFLFSNEEFVSKKSPIDLAIEKNLKDIAFILYCAGAKVSEAKLKSKGWGHFPKEKVDTHLYVHLDLLGIDRKAKFTFADVSEKYKRVILNNRADGRKGVGNASKIEKAKKAKAALHRWLSYTLLDLDPDGHLSEQRINTAVSKGKASGVDLNDLKTAKDILIALVKAEEIENAARFLLGFKLSDTLTGSMIIRACNKKTDSLSDEINDLKKRLKEKQEYIELNKNTSWMRSAVQNAEQQIITLSKEIQKIERKIEKFTDAKNTLITTLSDKDM